jgi:calcium-dependent protein kinase
VHRDLKPENLLLDEDSDFANIKVIDFGTSALLDNTRPISERYGTPYYTAPEILQNRFSEKCDVWSCGVILYLMLCGTPPFNGETDDDIYNQIIEARYSMEGELWNDVSQASKDLVSKMLTRNPKKRISASEALCHPWI